MSNFNLRWFRCFFTTHQSSKELDAEEKMLLDLTLHLGVFSANERVRQQCQSLETKVRTPHIFFFKFVTFVLSVKQKMSNTKTFTEQLLRLSQKVKIRIVSLVHLMKCLRYDKYYFPQTLVSASVLSSPFDVIKSRRSTNDTLMGKFPTSFGMLAVMRR